MLAPIPLVCPTVPEVAAEQRATGRVHLRYEDLAQDGRLTMAGMPHTIGQVFWQKLAATMGIGEQLRAQGVVPILTRLVTRGGDGPFPLLQPLEGDARYQLCRAENEDGAVTRLHLNVWIAIAGSCGRVYGPAPDNAGETLHAGEVFAEHTFTKLFAPPGERKVTELSLPGQPAVPEARYQTEPPAALLALPEGATALGDLALDPQLIVVGLDHTDSNQHVNSLIYPRWFREAALRRLQPGAMLARFEETAFRKPAFAGDRLRVALRPFELGDHRGACAMLIHDSDADRPLDELRGHAYARVLFGR